jgi:aspartate aminotransferase-like enzyme
MILLAPGPVPVPSAVLKAMSEKVLHHRTPEFERILTETWSGLKAVFQTDQPVQILAGTGTAAMEAAVVNILSPLDDVLIVVSGKFGERWAEICERYNVNTYRWNVDWGEPANLAAFEEQLKTNPHIKAVFTQACETSTATVHPVFEMIKLTRMHTRALFCVDAITAVGCMEMPMDEWDIDVMVAGSQKAFMIPTGLSFVALSERAWAEAERAAMPRFYLDLRGEKEANKRGETHFSTPTSLVVGLNTVLNRMRETGGMNRINRRCHVLAEATRWGGERLGLSVYSKAPSCSVTALKTPEGIDSAKIRNQLEKEKGITIMGGQDHLKGKILRIGHMGDVRDSDMVTLFTALAEVFNKPFEFKNELESRLAQAPPLFD